MEPDNTATSIIDAPEEKTLTISNNILNQEDFVGVKDSYSAIVLETCTSNNWSAVFSAIAQLKQVTQLTLRGCRFSRDHLPPLEKSALLKLTIGTNKFMLDKTSFEEYDLVKLRVPTLTHLVMSTCE